MTTIHTIIAICASLALSCTLSAASVSERLDRAQRMHQEMSQDIDQRRQSLHAEIVHAGGLTPVLRQEQEAINQLADQRDALAATIQIMLERQPAPEQQEVEEEPQEAQGALSGAKVGSEAGEVAGRDIAPLLAILGQVREFDAEAAKWAARADRARTEARDYAAGLAYQWMLGLDLSPAFAPPPAGVDPQAWARRLSRMNAILERTSRMRAAEQSDPGTMWAVAGNMARVWDTYAAVRPEAEPLDARVVEVLEQ